MSAWNFICCCWWRCSLCIICCWRNWWRCEGLVRKFCFSRKIFWENWREFPGFESVSGIGFSGKLVGSSWRGFGGKFVWWFGLSRKMFWGKDGLNFFNFLTLPWPRLPLRRETTLLNLNTASTIRALFWTWSWEWHKRVRTLWQLSTADLLASSTTSMLIHPSNRKKKNPDLMLKTPESQKQKQHKIHKIWFY